MCDKCNNYFGRKIEAPLLEEPFFKNARARQGILSKRGLIPHLPAYLIGSGPVFVAIDGASIDFKGNDASHTQKIFADIQNDKTQGIFIPLAKDELLDKKLMSRFLAKAAYEMLILRCLKVDGGLKYILNERQLDPVRHYARVGDRPHIWPFHRRRIYDENAVISFGDSDMQILHEMDLLVTPEREYYFVVCFFGEEFVLNLGGPTIDGYEKWLRKNHFRSPLYVKREWDRIPLVISN